MLVTGGLIAADQWTKYIVVRELTTRFDGLNDVPARLRAFYTGTGAESDHLHFRPKRSITVHPEFFRVRYAENPGAAWGLFRTLPEKVRMPLFHVVSLGAVLLISVYYSRLSGHSSERWAAYGLPVVLGGALGNYVDRAARGFVVDFLEAHWMDKAAWPSFNLADSAISIGVGMLLIDSLVRKEPKAAPEPSKA